MRSSAVRDAVAGASAAPRRAGANLRSGVGARALIGPSAGPVRFLVLALLGGYKKLVSPLLPPACRFYPSCSEYAFRAVERYGVARGILMAARRISRCNPLCRGGYDPLP